MSRGGKEGNNAFTHDNKPRKNQGLDLLKVLKYHPSVEIFKILQTAHLTDSFATDHLQLCYILGKVVRSGNFSLIKHLINDVCTYTGGYGFNTLHMNAVL